MNYVFVNVKPMNFFVCQAGAGNLNNNGRKGNKYHSAKAKNDRIRRVIMNNSFDLIKSDPNQSWKWSLVDISVSRSGDKSKIINSFELRKVAGRLVAWAEQLDFVRCYFPNQGWLYFIQCPFPTKSSQKMVHYCFDL